MVSGTAYYCSRGPMCELLFVRRVLCGRSRRGVLLDVRQRLCGQVYSRSVSWLSSSLLSPLRCRSCWTRSLDGSRRCICISGFKPRRRLSFHSRARLEISVWDSPWFMTSNAAESHGWVFERGGQALGAIAALEAYSALLGVKVVIPSASYHGFVPKFDRKRVFCRCSRRLGHCVRRRLASGVCSCRASVSCSSRSKCL